ncbi:pentapeptide repeat-containing protein [Streptomyces sp. NPDC057908]|uniref:pentapeptide repeat-containing protein n=1 Tax=Streptomyces sp. NPDC057908 TaxID=3346276 RepID=UPI0036E949F8
MKLSLTDSMTCRSGLKRRLHAGGVTLAGCDLTGADLRAADLTGARFGRVLTGAPPHGLTNATDTKLDKAVLRDLQLEEVIGWPITG